MDNKVVKFFKLLKYKIKEYFSWLKVYCGLKYRVKFFNIIGFIFALLKAVLFIGSFILITTLSDIIVFTNSIPSFNTNFQTEYITKTTVLGSQITLTLICVSLIALISNIESKYLYGERLLDLAFPHVFLSFKLLMGLLFSLLLCNIYLMLKEIAFVYTIFVFLMALYISVLLLYRFAIVFLSKASFKNKLFCKYYKANLTYIKKTKPINPYNSESLSKLYSITLKHLVNKDYPELNTNMILYFDLLKATLFNKPQFIQEFYTEYGEHKDFIGQISEFSLTLLYERNPLYGIQVYNTLLKHLNYYKVVCVQDVGFYSISFIEAFQDIHDKTQLKIYLEQLLIMSKNLIEQTYLYSIADLSYCRLGKEEGQIFYWAYKDMYEQIYDLIIKSDNISLEEKEEFIEKIRWNIIDNTHSFALDIENFKKRQRFPKERKKYNLDIKGEPIAKYFIHLIEKGDIQNIAKCRSLFGVSKEKHDYSVDFALILTILSVLNNIHNKGKRVYVSDIKIEKKEATLFIKRARLMEINLTDEILNNFYNLINKYYISDVENREAKGSIYHFDPKFYFSKQIVDSLFAYIYSRNHKDKTIEVIAEEKGLEFKKSIFKTISSFCSVPIKTTMNLKK